MIDIITDKKEDGNVFTILTNEGKFEISFGGTLDLYWTCFENVLSNKNFKTFTITKENYFLYSLFDELYENIKNCNLYSEKEINFSFCEDIEDLNKEKEKIKKYNDQLKQSQKQNLRKLFSNEIIKWHSDELIYEDASILNITKEDECFKVIFEKSKNTEDTYLTYSVRFRNSGSRYSPFNIMFMIMYNKLDNYEENKNQIYIEEYIYQKKTIKR